MRSMGSPATMLSRAVPRVVPLLYWFRTVSSRPVAIPFTKLGRRKLDAWEPA